MIGLTFFKTVKSNFASSTINFSSGASDGFCVSTESFTQRQSKIEFEEVMFSKGNMFSIQENDFQVRVCQNCIPSHYLLNQVPKSGFYNFQISFETDLCGALSLCGPTEVSIRSSSLLSSPRSVMFLVEGEEIDLSL